MRLPGKMQEIANEVLASNIDIIALQEIRWDGSGRVDKRRYAMFCSGTQTKTGQCGMGFIVTKRMKNNILQFEPINERMSKLRIKGKFRNITLITVHAPTEEKEEQEKKEFYDRLEEVCGKIPKYDVTIILGDYDAKIGIENFQSKVAGKFTLHKESNENGILLGQLATRNRMVIKSTCYPHKRIHLGTWRSPDNYMVNQIDHVLINTRHSSSIINVRSCGGPNCDTNHCLVKVKLRERISKLQHIRGNPRTKWNIDRFKDEEGKREYSKRINRKIEEQELEKEVGLSIEERWTKMEVILKESAEETIGERKREINNGLMKNVRK
jgi:hypothetical protein